MFAAESVCTCLKYHWKCKKHYMVCTRESFNDHPVYRRVSISNPQYI